MPNHRCGDCVMATCLCRCRIFLFRANSIIQRLYNDTVSPHLQTSSKPSEKEQKAMERTVIAKRFVRRYRCDDYAMAMRLFRRRTNTKRAMRLRERRICFHAAMTRVKMRTACYYCYSTSSSVHKHYIGHSVYTRQIHYYIAYTHIHSTCENAGSRICWSVKQQ